MQTQKEIVRDSVLATMRPYLNAVTMDILNQAIVSAMAHVDVVETETLPATNENTNNYILNVYLIKRKGVDWNMPTQKAMNLELFEVKETVINNPDGSVKISKTTKVTGKGQQYFINKFLKVA